MVHRYPPIKARRLSFTAFVSFFLALASYTDTVLRIETILDVVIVIHLQEIVGANEYAVGASANALSMPLCERAHKRFRFENNHCSSLRDPTIRPHPLLVVCRRVICRRVDYLGPICLGI